MPFGKLHISDELSGAALSLHLSGESEGCLYPGNTKLNTIQITANKSGRFVIVSGKLFSMKVVLANVFTPNVDDASLFNSLFIHFLISVHLILGSDFYCWMDPILHRSSTKPGLQGKSASHRQSFLSEYGVSDIWRFLDPPDKQYPFSSRVRHTYSRIDYILLTID